MMPVKLTPRRAPSTISEVCSWGQITGISVGLILGLGERVGDVLWVAAIARNPKKVRRCDAISF
jgi:hypothetical protein